MPLGAEGAAMADSRLYSVTFVLGFLWLTTFLNIFGFSAGQVAAACRQRRHVDSGADPDRLRGDRVRDVRQRHLVCAERSCCRATNFWDTIGLWSSLCFAFSGFEISSMVGQEVYNPRKTIPRSIVLSGIAITAIYILSSASILVAVPASEMAERSGIADAVELVTSRLGLAGIGAFIAFLLVVGSIGGTSSWIAGAARVPFAAGVDAAMPAAFAKLHSKYRTPHVALIVQAIATTALFLVSVFLSVGGGETTIQEAYDIMVNLTILIYFLPYLYLFAAFIRLRSMDAEMPVGREHRHVAGRHRRRLG